MPPGGTGLGCAIGLVLARPGAEVAIGYSVSTDEAAAMETELPALGVQSSAFRATFEAGRQRGWS